jgi:hypothetical protein
MATKPASSAQQPQDRQSAGSPAARAPEPGSTSGSRDQRRRFRLRPAVVVFALLAAAVATWTLTAAWASKSRGTARAAVDPTLARKAKAPRRSSLGSEQDTSTPALVRPDSFRVMTYNVRYDNPRDEALGRGWMSRRTLVLQVVLDLLPDIVGFQELARTHRLPESEQPDAFMKARLEPAGYRVVPGIGTSPTNIFYKASRFSVEASSSPHATYLWPDPRATMCPD